MDKESKEIIVIGAGVFRTGTNSLKLALQTLLHKKCYHMKEVIANPSHIPLWIKALENDNLTKEEWNQIFENFEATVDFPSTIFLEKLMEHYPNAKVILTIRDPQSWIISVKKTVYKAQKYLNSFPLNIFIKLTPMRKLPEFLNLTHTRIISVPKKDINEQSCIDQFLNWTEHVKSIVPPEKLLIFESKQGWKPLCEFLNVPEPEVSYPHVNTADEMLANIENGRKLAYFVVCAIPVLLGIVATVAWFLH